ncbi:MAG: hypothetical protein LBM00_03515 [Deltaproteobacteria bacterium]|jgi:hypothetical protein|nr:hypothetical protein [Deltaproteobacteria bacterium]
MKISARLFIVLLPFALLMLHPLSARAMDMNEAAASMSREMDAQLALRFGAAGKNISIIVTTPVDINNFEESCVIARQIQEYLSYWLVQAGYGVQEIRGGKAILFRKDTGELLLTRDRELIARKRVGSVLTLVGTYTLTSKTIIFNVRLIQTGGQEVYAMSSISIPVTKETRTMLNLGANASSSGSGHSYVSIEPSVYSRLP